MKENYFVITNSDGDTTVEEYTKEELLERLNEKWWGDRCAMTEEILKKTSNTNYWEDNILIIKGTVCVPKPKEVIETYDID